MNRKVIIILFIVGALVLCGGIAAYVVYQKVMGNQIKMEQQSYLLYLSSGSTYNTLVDSLDAHKMIDDKKLFDIMADRKSLKGKNISGRYELKKGMTYNALINMMRSGNQKAIRLTFNNNRLKDEFISKVASKFEFQEEDLGEIFNDEIKIAEFGFNKETFLSMFLPDTYEIYWDISAEEFCNRMKKEYDKFWNAKRIKKAKAMGYSPQEISIIASIVYSETKNTSEMSRVAGVYINRLEKSWLLQACPTVIYAIGDFSITKVLDEHLEFDSPYNTYKYLGLPPGPIHMPSKKAIELTLNYEQHDYMFFCANPDMTQSHVFAKTNAQHNRNAARYHSAYRQWRRNRN